eukprot:s1525_g25.t1
MHSKQQARTCDVFQVRSLAHTARPRTDRASDSQRLLLTVRSGALVRLASTLSYRAQVVATVWQSWQIRRSIFATHVSSQTQEKHRHECLLLQRLEGFSSKEVQTEVRANVALLISLHAFIQTDPTGNMSDLLDLVQEPLSRPGARRRARLRAVAAKLFLEILGGGDVQRPPGLGPGLGLAALAAEDLSALLAAVPLNAFGLGPEGRDGHCLAPAASKLSSYTNHSCVPNCVEEIGGGCVRFVALRDIEAGEEITFSYLDLSLPLEDRKSLMKTSWDFSCDCARCRGTPCAEALAFDEEHLCHCGAILLRKEETCRCDAEYCKTAALAAFKLRL